MQLKTWLNMIRLLNLLSAAMLIGFEIWLIVLLIIQFKWGQFFLKIWAPVFMILLALLIISAQFKYQKIVQNFKFLLWLPGLALFNLFMASILAFQFITAGQQVASIVFASFFIAIAIGLFILHFLKPIGAQGLLNDQMGITA